MTTSRMNRVLVGTLALAAFFWLSPVQAQSSSNGLQVTLPNGYPNINADDLRINSSAGIARVSRRWDGQEWKFNPQWESLSLSWKNLTGSQAADTTGSSFSSSGGSASNCWVRADDDWSPSITVSGTTIRAAALQPLRSVPFNRLITDSSTDYAPAQHIDVDYATLCPGSASSFGDVQAIRRASEMYLGENGQYSFNNRSGIDQRAVRQLATASAAVLYAQVSAGQISLVPVNNAKGYRWSDKSGQWMDYNTQGQMVAWGDQNGNLAWLLRDTDGILRAVIDAHGQVLFSLHYTGQLLTEVRDYAASATDLPARSVKYQYDASNRLTQVTDVRGNTIKYDYDSSNHIFKITDQEGRIEQLAYNGDVVSKRTAPDGGVTDYVFDYDDVNKQFVSKITGPVTEAGRRVEEWTHNRVGQVVRQVVNGRTDLQVRYDTGARAETRTNARGFATGITRNEFDQVVRMDYPDGTSQSRVFSSLHLELVEETDELGVKTQYQYDAMGNLIKKIEAAGTADERTTDYVVNSLGQSTQATRTGRTEANGTITADATWQVEYDSRGQIKKTTDPEGNVNQITYDRAGNLQRITDPRGNSTNYEVDADGNLTKVTDALGRVTRYQYDKVGNALQVIDARAKTTQTAYDSMNRSLRVTNALGGVQQMQYDSEGEQIGQTDEDGRTKLAKFDTFLRLIQQIDGAGNTTSYSYAITDGSNAGTLGALDSPTEIDYPTFTQQQRFDSRERLTSNVLLNTNSQGDQSLASSGTYDKRSFIATTTDANGKTRGYTRNALGQLISATDVVSNNTQALYDTRGNVIQITDAKGNVNKFEFDRNDRVVKEILPLGQTITGQYDAAGNLVQRVDAKGIKSVYSYDAANRLTELKVYDAANVLVRSTTYTFDAANNLSAWTDTDHSRNQTSSATSTFDDLNRKKSETVTYPSGSTLSYSYNYSAAGLKTQLTWPDSTQIGYSYSANAILQGVSIPGEGSISVNTFKWLVPSKVTLPGGVTEELSFDGLLDLESLKVKNSGQQATLNLTNAYGKLQELKTSNRTDSTNGGSSTVNSSFAYDDELRLTQATTDTGGVFGIDTETFTLDQVANRTAHSKVSGAWTYDANNRLTRSGSGSSATDYQYDDSGNLVQRTAPGSKVTQFSYDSQNRLIEVKEGSGNPIARYGYDPFGRRIWKEQFRSRDGTALTQALHTTYLYADEGLIAEASQNITLNADLTVTANGAATITAQYGPSPDSMFTTGTLFVKTKNSNGVDSFAYFHLNHLGTPIQATDKLGNVMWAASYNAFGHASITTPSATAAVPTITSNLRLPGQYEDQETGLHYNYQRYYDPSTGRYVQSDPIGLKGGINKYAYVGGNPVSYTDPQGLFVPLVIVGVCAAGGCEAAGAVLAAGAIWWATQHPVVLPVATLSEPMYAKPPRVNDADAEREWQEYKDRYAQPPPPNQDNCERLRWRLKREKELLAARQAWDAKWGPHHEDAIAQSKQAVKNAEEKLKKAGCQCP